MPFQYLPSSGVLSYYSSISFDFILEYGFPNGVIYDRKRLAKNQEIYHEALIGLVENPEDIVLYTTPPEIVDQVSKSGPIPFFEYAIITKPDLFSAFEEFIEWKRKKGIDIGLVSIDDIAQQYMGDMIFPGFEIINEHWTSNQHHAGKLRQYLHDAYNEGTTWALLAGDVTKMPARLGTIQDTDEPGIVCEWSNVMETDLYFGDFTGNWNVDGDKYFGEPNDDSPDYYFEIFVGRLICATQEDIQNWVTKVLKYEQNPGNGDFSYLTRSFMTQADEFQRDLQAEAVIPHLQGFTHEVWGEEEGYAHPNPTHPTAAEVVVELNSTKYGLMSSFNHGGTAIDSLTQVGNSGYLTANRNMNNGEGGPRYKLDAEEDKDWPTSNHEDGDGLDNLLNYDHPFIIYSLSCDQNPYHQTKAVGLNGSRNFAESFTVNNLAGGVAHLGATRGAEVNFTYHMYKSFGDIISNPDNQYSTYLGMAEATSKMFNFFHHKTALTHNLIGCPETRIWTQTPIYFQAELSKQYAKYNGPNDLEVVVSNLPEGKDAIVCLYKQGEQRLTETITGNANNSATATFNQFELQSEGELFVTITAQNYIPFMTSVPVAYVVDTDQTWTSDITIESDLLVAECAELTIRCTLLMGPQKKIMISQCSHLVVDDGVINSLPGAYWQGIQVWGNYYASQMALPGQSNPQGKLTLNDAVVKNAVNAITLWNPEAQHPYQTTGGIVMATGTSFLNNKRSAEFLSYQNFSPIDPTVLFRNVSYFKNCSFEVDDDYLIPSDFDSHITMWDVDGIKLTANTFSNSMTEVTSRGKGIYTIDASYRVMPGCSSQITPCPTVYVEPNIFLNLEAGIYATNASSTNTIHVDSAEFYGNGYGVILNSVNNATIIRSKFHIGVSGISGYACSTDFGIGIDITNSNGYIIEENEFKNNYNTETDNLIGIRVYNDLDFHLNPNEIYNNNFQELKRANLAEGKNLITNDELNGLVYQCNSNSQNFFDFYVVDQGIAGMQGSSSKAAGNTFTQIHDPITHPRHISNLADNHITYYHSLVADEVPLYITKNVDPIQVSTAFGCPSSFGGGTGELDPKGLTEAQEQYFEQEVSENQAAYTGVRNLYNSLLDGGNTEEVKTDISMAWPEDMWDLRAELLDLSPLLSKEVLVAASDRTDVLPESIIFEVLSANPDELKKKELMEYLENKDNPLPAYLIEILRSLTGNVTYKTILQSQMVQYDRLSERAYGILLRDMLNDSLVSADSIRDFLASKQSLPMDVQIVDALLKAGETDQALALSASLPQIYELEGDALTEYGRYIQLKQLQAGLISQERNIFQLTDSEKAQLEGLIEESSGLAGMQARNILSFVYGFDYCDCPAPIEDSLKTKPVNTSSKNKLSEPMVQVHPNPATTWASFDYQLAGAATALLEITDTKGRLIHRVELRNKQGQYVWDTRQINAGLYYYTLKTGQTSKTGKLVVER